MDSAHLVDSTLRIVRRYRTWSPRGRCWCVAAAPTDRRGSRSARRRPPSRAGAAIGSSSARNPPTNIEASACTRRIGRSSANQRGPGVSWIRALLSGPSGPATMPNSARPIARRGPRQGHSTRSCHRRYRHGRLCFDDGVVVGEGSSADLDQATAEFVAVRGRLFGIAYRMLGQPHRGRGHRPRGLAPMAEMRPHHGRRPRGVPGHDDHPAVHQRPAISASTTRNVHRPMASRARRHQRRPAPGCRARRSAGVGHA